MADDIKLQLTLEEKQVLDALTKLTKSSEDFSSKASSGFKKSSTAFDVFQGTLTAGIALKALGSLKNAAVDLFDTFVTDGIKAASEQEDAINSLNVALKSSGQYTNQTSKDLQDFATSLQATTRYGDETILGVTSLIASLSKLDKDGLKQATAASLDLAASLNMDLNTAAMLVGKAAAGSIDTFSRYGIEIRKGASDSETFANTMAALAKQQGAASDKTKTYTGALEQASNIFSDIQETSGSFITSNATIISLINTVGKEFATLNESLGSNKGAFSSLVSDGVMGAITAVGVFVTALDLLVRAGDIASNSITSAGKIMALGIIGPIGLIEAGIVELIKLIPGMSSKFGESSGVIADLALKLADEVQEDFKQIDDAMSGDTALSRMAENLALMQEKVAIGAEEELVKLKENEDAKNAIKLEGQVSLDTAMNDLATVQSEMEKAQQDAALVQLKKYYDSKGKLRTNLTKDEQAEMVKQAKIVDEGEKKKLAIRTQTFEASANLLNALSGLAALGGAKTFAITKALALAAIPIDTAAGIMKALASLPPPASWLQATAVGVMGATQLIKVASSKPPSFATGGIVPGTPPISGGDNVVANVRSQEVILNEAQSGVLANKLSSSSGPSVVIVQIDGREIARTVVEQRKQGFPV